jgi:hypothetical protein
LPLMDDFPDISPAAETGNLEKFLQGHHCHEKLQ